MFYLNLSAGKRKPWWTWIIFPKHWIRVYVFTKLYKWPHELCLIHFALLILYSKWEKKQFCSIKFASMHPFILNFDEIQCADTSESTPCKFYILIFASSLSAIFLFFFFYYVEFHFRFHCLKKSKRNNKGQLLGNQHEMKTSNNIWCVHLAVMTFISKLCGTCECSTRVVILFFSSWHSEFTDSEHIPS